MARGAVVCWTLVLLTLGSPVLAQSQGDSSIPTIPESQIEPRALSSTYEFLSTADAADAFAITAGKMALGRAAAGNIKTLAQTLIDDHTRMQQALRAAGEADRTEVAAASPDGEQKGLLNKMEAVKGADFDRLYVESQIFLHQRTIAIFKGYQKQDNNLGRYAAKTLPSLVQHYSMIIEAAGGLQAVGAVQ
ncbi:MAG: DUF4142 domain-containing protein [Methylobacterium mesophilicum]|nr:DUF4142 domain-containing protein [Methylobacterium mesophilicum]